ncbi:MAG: hypothetical protein HKO85_01765, partial [Xanthomonadales bacterium]|nr:hypothetical protein [Xanthomonadales bacterium]
AISIGNYWQGVVAERFDYATVLYFDAAIAVLVILVIPFLRKREAPVVPPTVEPVPAKS